MTNQQVKRNVMNTIMMQCPSYEFDYLKTRELFKDRDSRFKLSF